MEVKLVMFKGSGQRKEFPVVNNVTVIGRGENCDLRVPLLSVSRRHCELSTGGNQVRIKDLASSNGTYVNNKRVNEAVLNAGDRLVVGPIVFTVQIDGKPEQILPVKTMGQRLAEAGEPAVEEVVDLEADIVAQPGASVGEETLPPASIQPGPAAPAQPAKAEPAKAPPKPAVAQPPKVAPKPAAAQPPKAPATPAPAAKVPPAKPAPAPASSDDDVIAALEALANEPDEEEKKQK